MKDRIEHSGTIEAIEGDHVRVNILQVSACGSCKAKAMCSQSESEEEIIDVFEKGADKKYRVGEHVNVCGTLSMGRQAVALAFGIPLVMMVVWLLVALVWLKLGDLLSVGLMALMLFIYFYTLYIYREKFSKHFAFWIAREGE